MIRYGPAGIPLSCKGRTLKDGIEDVHNLCLTALEVQMVRPQTEMRPPEEEIDEIGSTIMDLGSDSGFAVGLYREEEGVIFDPHEKIEEEDYILNMSSGAIARFGDLPQLRNMALRHDIQLSVHAPYYMDLGANMENVEDRDLPLTLQCFDTLCFAGMMAKSLGAYEVVTSVGPYDPGRDREETDMNIEDNLHIISEWWKSNEIDAKIGIEITGQQDVFGSLDQVLDLCDGNKSLYPVLNFPHYHSRTGGLLQTADDFIDVISKVAPYYGDESIYTSFASVEFDENGNEKWVMPIKRGDLKFERLVEAMVDLDPEMTIISCSPLLEHDAVYMKTLTERVLTKRATKFLKEQRKAAAAAEEAAAKAASKAKDEERSNGPVRETCQRDLQITGRHIPRETRPIGEIHHRGREGIRIRGREVRTGGPDLRSPPGTARPQGLLRGRHDNAHNR